jgi:hypothetical protein
MKINLRIIYDKRLEIKWSALFLKKFIILKITANSLIWNALSEKISLRNL